ncbi:MAG: cation transporter [Gammaproteobacteria bacterium]|nr:cation transporter [Gammaproteobacteria bacterium]
MTAEAETRAERRFRETKRVTLIGAVVNLLLSIVKLAFGWIAQSQALLADGIHSLSDLLSDALVWFAAAHSAQGPDSDHPYGHGRFETLATLGLGLLLALVAVGIIWDASSRLFSPERLLIPGSLALVVALMSVVAKEWLYHFTVRVARRVKSDMLRANAWHHRTDAISSVVVIVGVAGTIAGLPYLDAIATIGVGLMIAHVGWELVWPAVQELADAGLEEERLQQIRNIILSVNGVKAIHMLRTRSSGGQASADVHVLVNPKLSVSEGHMISQMVMDNLTEDIEEMSDVTVHIDPEDDEVAAPSKDLPMRDAAEELLSECWREIPEVVRRERMLLHFLDGKIDIELFFPLYAYQGLKEAEELTGLLQERVKEQECFRKVRIYFG